jgi:hypothetical protein
MKEREHVPQIIAVSMAMSRRQFLGTVAGAASLLLSPSFLSPAHAGVCADPSPIPGGLPALGHFYHWLAPGHPMFGTLDPDKEDPSTITDFNGHIGLAYGVGMSTHTDKVQRSSRHPLRRCARKPTLSCRHHFAARTLLCTLIVNR